MNTPILDEGHSNSDSIQSSFDFDEIDQIRFYITEQLELRGFAKRDIQEVVSHIPHRELVGKDFSSLIVFVQSKLIRHETCCSSEYRSRQPSQSSKTPGMTQEKSLNLVSFLNSSKRRSKSACSFKATCQICYEECTKPYAVPICGHSFCRDCIIQACKERIFNGDSDQLKCPQINCQAQIPDEELQQLLDEQLYAKMRRFRKIKSLALDQEVIWCPNPQCDDSFKYKGKRINKVCPTCSISICTACQKESHKGDCKSVIDKEYQKAISLYKIQKCKKCKTLIQKDDGCNHMVCKQCKYEFCWLCREEFTMNHYSSYNLFGCAGLQFSQSDPFRFPNLRRFLVIAALTMLVIPTAVLALFIAIVLAILGFPILVYFNFIEPWENFRTYSWLKQCSTLFFLTILSIACLPFNVVAVCTCLIILVTGLPYIIYSCIQRISD